MHSWSAGTVLGGETPALQFVSSLWAVLLVLSIYKAAGFLTRGGLTQWVGVPWK